MGQKSYIYVKNNINFDFAKTVSLILIFLTFVLVLPLSSVYADSSFDLISEKMIIDLDSADYFNGASPVAGYYGSDNKNYVYAGGGNTLYANKVPYNGTKINGYQVKTAVSQMIGIRVGAGATVTAYFAPGGANRSIYMIDKAVAYASWEKQGVTVFASANEEETTITNTFAEETDVYFAASGPCYIGVIEVSYPNTGNEVCHFAMDGGDSGLAPQGDVSYVQGIEGKGAYLNGGCLKLDKYPLPDSYTFSSWIKPEQAGDNTELFSFGIDGENYVSFLLSNSSGQSVWKMSVNGSEKKLTMGTPFKPDKWMHVAVTYESESRKIQIYVNGKPMLSDIITLQAESLAAGEENYIGKNSGAFKGVIDEVRIFDYAMAETQLAELISEEAPEIVSVNTIEITVRAGESVLLPQEIEVSYAGDSTGIAEVEWDNFKTPDVGGVYEVLGTVNFNGKTAEAKAVVTVSDSSDDGRYSVAQILNLSNSAGINRVNADFNILAEEANAVSGYIALYDGEERLVSFNTETVNTERDKLINLNVSAEIPQTLIDNKGKVKIMLWEEETQKPITENISYDLNELVEGDYANAANIQLETGSLFEESEQIGLDYLLGVDVDRLLAPEYEVHGLNTPNNASRYAGWETQTGNKTLAGHSLGHFMSAAAVMYNENGNTDLLSRLNYIVDKLDELQETTGSGYIGGCKIDAFNTAFSGVPNWTEGGYWVPWYGIHKIYQGLIDTYYYTDNPKALEVVKRFADWAVEGCSKLTYGQMQAMISVEYGGMNEVFAELYEITGEEKYLETARGFTQDSLLTPLSQGRDNLSGKHSNTQIPKVIGAAKLYELDNEKYADYRTAAENFWSYVVNDRSYAIGGNSIAEHFEELGAETLGIKTCESCNTYNMLRLTEKLFAWNLDSKYMDYYETALYNHILGQQDPDTGSKEYFISLLQGHHRIYEEKYNSWWCCTGTGMENPARYTRNIYYENGNDLYVNLYMPNTYLWKEKGLTFKTETDYPYSDTIKMIVVGGESDANIKLRVPSWAESGATATVGGETYTSGSGYMEIERSWKEGDVLQITIPMSISIYTQRAENRIVYKYGPIVLGSERGSVSGVAGVKEYNSRERDLDSVAVDVPYIITDGKNPADIIEPVNISELTFKISAANSSDGQDIILKPFFDIHHQFYNVYWDLDKESDTYEKALNKITVDRTEPDGQQDELAHDMACESSHNGSFASGTKTYFWRDAFGTDSAYFSYSLGVDNTKDNYLYVRYWGDDTAFESDGKTYNRQFDIFIDDIKLSSQRLNADKPGTFFDVFYQIPADLLNGKERVIVKFAPENSDCCAGRVLEIRTTTEALSK